MFFFAGNYPVPQEVTGESTRQPCGIEGERAVERLSAELLHLSH